MRIKKVQPLPAATVGSLADGTVFRFGKSDCLYLATDRREDAANGWCRQAVDLSTGFIVLLVGSATAVVVSGEFVEGATS